MPLPEPDDFTAADYDGDPPPPDALPPRMLARPPPGHLAAAAPPPQVRPQSSQPPLQALAPDPMEAAFAEMMRPTSIGVAGIDKVEKRSDRAVRQATDLLTGAMDSEEVALARKQTNEQTLNAAVAPLMKRHAELAAELAKDTAVAHAQAQSAVAKQQKVVAGLEQSIAASPANDGFWADKSIGSQIGWGIALAMGAFAQAASRGQIQTNPAMQMFDRALHQDAVDKARKLAGMREHVAGERNVLIDIRQAVGDDDAALHANYIAGVGKIEAQIKQAMADNVNPIARQNGEIQLAQLGQRKAMAYASMAEKGNAVALQAEQAKAGLLSQQEHMDMQSLIAQYNAMKKQQSDAKGTSYRAVVPNFLPSQTQKSFDDLSKAYGDYWRVHGPISEVQTLLAPRDAEGNRHPVSAVSKLSPTAFATLKSSEAKLTLKLADAFHRGAAFSDSEQNLIRWVEGGGQLWEYSKPDVVVSALDRLRDFFQDEVMSVAKSTGQLPVQGRNPFDPKSFEDALLEEHFSNRPQLQREVGGRTPASAGGE